MRNGVVSCRPRERIGLVINDLPSAESKAPSQFGGVLLASVPAHTSPRTRATTHTLHSGVHRSLGALLRAGAFGLASPVHCIGFLSLAVSRVHLVCCLVVRSSSSPEMVRVPEGCSRAWTSTSAPLGGWRRSTQASRCTSGAAATLPRVGVGPAAPRDLHRDRGHHASQGALLH